MSIQLEDPLYQIFEDHLHSGLYDDQPVEALVRDVVDFYWTTLQRSGHIPHRMQDLVRVDLIQDVTEMLRTKIYGHYGVAEYNQLRNKKGS